MATTGYGNWHSKKDKYSICRNCKRKGYYKTPVPNRDSSEIKFMEKCMYCNLCNAISEEEFKQRCKIEKESVK